MNASEKSTVEEIRTRFDNDVDRFSNLETGQSATMDAPIVLDLITRVAAEHYPTAQSVLDIGCGAGNYTLKILERIPGMSCTLIDLSQPMLDRARQRILGANATEIDTNQGDIREVELLADKYDVVMAAAVLHHLRGDADWTNVFRKIYAAMRTDGIFLVSDLVASELPAVDAVQQQRYGEYLSELRDDAYRQTVFDYIQKEDTPRSILYQIDVCRTVGFRHVEVLHFNACFGAYCAVK